MPPALEIVAHWPAPTSLIAALVLAKHPELTPYALKSVLHATASNSMAAKEAG